MGLSKSRWSWRFRQAQRRYSRGISDIWATRQDARGLAVHLQDSLPMSSNTDSSSVVWASVVHSAEAWHGRFRLQSCSAASAAEQEWLAAHPAVAEQRVHEAAAALGSVWFWVTDRHSGEKFAVYVVKSPGEDMTVDHEAAAETESILADHEAMTAIAEGEADPGLISAHRDDTASSLATVMAIEVAEGMGLDPGMPMTAGQGRAFRRAFAARMSGEVLSEPASQAQYGPGTHCE